MRLRRWAIGAAIATAATAAALTPQSFAYADQQQAPENQPAVVQQADQTYANPATAATAPVATPEATAPQSGTVADSTTSADVSSNGPANEPASEPAQTPDPTDGIQAPGTSDAAGEDTIGGSADSSLTNEIGGSDSSMTGDVTTDPIDSIEPAENEPIENEILRDIPTPASEPASSEHYADPKDLADPTAAPQITIQGRTGTYATLEDAIAAARAGDTIVVSGEIRDVNGLTINKSLSFIASENGAHIIFANQHGMLVTNGATLTLGDMSSNQIAMIATHEDSSIRNQEDRYIVKVTDGHLILNDSAFLRLAIDGPDITTAMGPINGKAVNLDGPDAHGTINGGTVQSFNVYRCTATSNIALNVSNGASIDTISGGEFVSYQESLEVYVNSSIGTISGGTFKSLQHFTGGGSRVNAYLENSSHIGTISGGTFVVEPLDGSEINATTPINAFVLMLGSSIDAITGGTFYVPGQLPYRNPNLRAAFLVFRNPSATESGFGQIRIGTISGGTFSGPIGLMLSNGESTHPENDTVIGSITGGTFISGAPDNPLRDGAMGYGLYSTSHNTIGSISTGTFTGQAYGAWNSGNIDSISNGAFTGNVGGLLNDGVIDEISDGDFTGGDYGLFQVSGSTTHIGKITGGRYTATGLNLPMRGSAIRLAKPTPIEPDLVTEIGNARFKGIPERSDDGQGAFEGLANAIFPESYHVSQAVDADGFHYLVIDVVLTYDPNGGTGMAITYPREGHSTYVVSNNLFTRDGFRFVGWNTQADGTGTEYAPGDFLTLGIDDPTMTLYAQWVEGDVPPVTPDEPKPQPKPNPQAPTLQPQAPVAQTSVEAPQEQALPQHAANAIPQTGDHVRGMAAGTVAVAVASLIGMVVARCRRRNG